MEISTSDLKVKPAALLPLNEARVYSISLFMNGKIYVLGGKNSYSGGRRCRNVEAYTPGEDAWRVVGETPDEQLDFCACAFQDRIYLFDSQNV